MTSGRGPPGDLVQRRGDEGGQGESHSGHSVDTLDTVWTLWTGFYEIKYEIGGRGTLNTGHAGT